MDWYTVIKTIKGHRYIYRQRTWREGDKIKTESRYVGPLGKDEAGLPAPVNTTKKKKASKSEPSELRLEGEGEYILTLLSGRSVDGWTPAYNWNKQPTKSVPQSDTEVWDLGLRMGVAMVTQMWPMPGANNCPVYSIKHHRISIPDRRLYQGNQATAGRRAALDLLHELVHATMKDLGRRRVRGFRDDQDYAREELVAEIGANIVARRLGIEVEDTRSAQVYLAAYRERLENSVTDVAWAINEAKRAADHILKHHSRGGWTAPVNTTKKRRQSTKRIKKDRDTLGS